MLGLPKPEIAGLRISGFAVGSFNYNSHIQMIPEFAGEASAHADPRSTNFRFDRFNLTFSKVFAPWLSASAAIEVENHRTRSLACPDPGPCESTFSQDTETEISLDRFNLTAIAPIGNGLALSIGRYDVPFGIERHDEPLNLTATTSEVFNFGRPASMTGFQASYAFAPWMDVSAWIVNRWENEATGEHDLNDNNRGKSFGGRIGFTPVPLSGLLNFGVGGFFGPEQDDNTSNKRWVVDFDFTLTPLPRLLFAGEFVYGGEANRELLELTGPIAAPAEVKDVKWLGFYLLTHYDVSNWLGVSFRYGYFDDLDGGRTGVKQVLQSWTIAPIVHLSRLIPDLRPRGPTYARTRHPIDWIDLKLEYRVNHSNKPVFANTRPGEDITVADTTSHQVQFQLVINF